MNYTEQEIDIIVLSSFEELTYSAKRTLLSDFKSASPDFTSNKNLLIKTLSSGVYNKVKGKFSDTEYRAQVLRELEEQSVVCVTYFSESYPESLKGIDAPPVMLYCKGDVSLLKTECFSVVGSRATPPKKLADCAEISARLTKAFTLVSGLADGVDSCALQSALDAGGKVISVLSNGLDKAYPACNANLMQRISREGLLITEYRYGVVARSFHFPFRNRIIAALSVGTLVASAGNKSGALITASYALEFGKDVFAIPDYPGNPSGEGCNFLIKKGAYLTENILDIFDFYGLDFKASEKKQLTSDEQAVFGILKNCGEAAAFEIAQKLDKALYGVLAVITMLEMKGLVCRLGGNRFKAKNIN